ncbi:MAG: 3-deoxy-manno-octulosonate cytidylyltransferase [Rhodospirillales bacterium]
MTIAFVPARMASSRFPGKPLVDIHGVPMVGHCYFRTDMAKTVDATYVATCDQVVGDYCDSAGIPWVMTKDTHERATDRVAEAMLKVEEKTGTRHNIVVLVQGDEPMLRPEMIDLAVAGLIAAPDINVVNLMLDMDPDDFADPNEVKVVCDQQSNALYFSREPIPSLKMAKGAKVPMRKQFCLMPFRRDFLLEYNEMPQTPLEKIESCDMLRIVESGGKVRMVYCPGETVAVDTQADLDRVRKFMATDDLMAAYAPPQAGRKA